MKFNINNEVKVKLTKKGYDILRKDHDEMMARYPKLKLEFNKPKKDADGFTKFQLWELMRTFGSACYNGCNPPFETEIEIP